MLGIHWLKDTHTHTHNTLLLQPSSIIIPAPPSSFIPLPHSEVLDIQEHLKHRHYPPKGQVYAFHPCLAHSLNVWLVFLVNEERLKWIPHFLPLGIKIPQENSFFSYRWVSSLQNTSLVYVTQTFKQLSARHRTWTFAPGWEKNVGRKRNNHCSINALNHKIAPTQVRC